MNYHNVLSKTARALAAYIIAAEITGADEGHVFPVKNSLDKQLDSGLVICDCLRWTSDEGNPGRYLVETRISIKTPVAIQPQDVTPQTERLASEQFVAAVFDLFFTNLVQQDFTQLADAITAAGRQLSVADPQNNSDLAQFKCDEVTFSGGSGDANQDGTFWEDVLNLTLFVRPVADGEPPEPQ